MKEETIDIAIIGGGVSGVYSAWKLKQKPENKNKKIVVFEGSDHIGGRLLSVQPPGIPNMVAELGGMRILENAQPLIVKLIKDLNKGLPKNNQIELYPFPVDQPQNLAYLRGEYLRLSDFTSEPNKVPYQLTFLEKGNTPGSVIVNAIEQIVPGITDPDLTEDDRRKMAQEASFAGEPLYKQGFWNVLYRVISGEAYQFGMDAGGYDSTLLNWNAADAIPWYLTDFGINPVYKGFKNGFQQVPLTLADFFEKIGGEIRLKHKLESFEYVSGKFHLVVNSKVVVANTLILAMPRRSLDLLAPTCPPLQSIEQLTGSVTPRPLFKLFTTYSSPWWLAAGYTAANGTFVPVNSGRSVTDLPVRQTYYWPNNDGSPAVKGEAMLLASYDDGNNIGFWDGLRPQRSRTWEHNLSHPKIDNPFVGDAPHTKENEAWHQHQAPAKMVAEVARQLQLMHGLSHTPIVNNAAFRDWGEDPFGGGWNSWNIGVKSWEVKHKITHPIEVMPLHICGEAYSDYQGWVEGALQTAELMLAKIS
ncbi:amine oxidase [Mucilaginibacter sp. PPCGB 2223]|uniref:flavin monoamine oxidase family protein n=1 Tax=Mucilaginibacter sp. PPCGB 2223 TaxID=1886027 RepID=UPI00082603EF|nr:FAD-dependent oxidoreductase [Mucilaginibacter sp. PPCGB 2223]OCX53258.1 amine oxidase [Mucilaginibacter sp. PPCGB 2223]